MANLSAWSGVSVHSIIFLAQYMRINPCILPPCTISNCAAFQRSSWVFPFSNCCSEYRYGRLSFVCCLTVSFAHSYFCPSIVSYFGLYQQKLSASSRRTMSSSKKVSTACFEDLAYRWASRAQRWADIWPKCKYGERPESAWGLAGSFRCS